MISILAWIGMGLCGYWLVLKAYKKLTGYVTVGRCLQQSPTIILGPLGVVFGLLLHIDLHFDNPKKEEEPGWLNKIVW